MSENLINLGISPDVVEPILRKQIQAAVVANIGDPTEIINKVVEDALQAKVNENGKISRYHSDNTYDYLDLVVRNSIKKAANEAVEEWLAENTELLKKAVIRELNKPDRQNSIAKAFANAAEDAFKCSWCFDCRFDFKAE